MPGGDSRAAVRGRSSPREFRFLVPGVIVMKCERRAVSRLHEGGMEAVVGLGTLDEAIRRESVPEADN